MYLRGTRQKRADGSFVTHLQLAESVWNPQKKRSEVRIVHNCGRAEAPHTAERLRHLARSILKKCAPEEIVQHAEAWRLIDAWPDGPLYVLEALWQRLGLTEIIADQLQGPQNRLRRRTRPVCHGGQPSLCPLFQALLL